MSILAYSELMKRITGIDERRLDEPFRILSKHSTTKNRMNVLKELARHDKIGIGKLLRSMKQNIGGGSYLTIQKYFFELEKEGILVKENIDNKTLWSFSKKYSELKEYVSR